MTVTALPTTRLVGRPVQIVGLPYRYYPTRPPQTDRRASREFLIEEQLSRFIDANDGDGEAAAAALGDWNPKLPAGDVAELLRLSEAVAEAEINGSRVDFDQAIGDYGYQLQQLALVMVK